MKLFGINNHKTGKLTYNVSKNISSPEKEYLKQAKGVVENYLKDKKENISISIRNSILGDNDCLSVSCTTNTRQSITDIIKNGDLPLLRKVYMVIEDFAKDCK